MDGDLRRIFQQRLPQAQWTSIESGATGQGIPDSEYCFPGGVSGWIEFKKTDTDKIHHLSSFQISWLERRCRLGGRAFVAVRRGQRLYLARGEMARSLKDDGLSLTLHWEWPGGQAGWDWLEIEAILKEER